MRDTGVAIDGPRLAPLVANYQAADLVIGQPDFLTNADRGISARSFSPDGITFAEGHLWATDWGRHRVLGWASPTATDASATIVLGQTSFDAGAATNASGTTLLQPLDVVAIEGYVAVADGYSRVLIWNRRPTGVAAAANLVLGQPDFLSSAPGLGAAELRNPSGVWTDGSRLLVRGGEQTFHLWSWNQFPMSLGEPADQVLVGGLQVNAAEFASTGTAIVDKDRLILTDPLRNRILIWNTVPATTGIPADLVLGQASFSSSSPGTTAGGMSRPTDVLVHDGALFVADSDNDRVLVFDPFPTTSGATATQVLGQADLDVVVTDAATTSRSLNGPRGLATDGRHLYVADRENRRIVRYAFGGQ
ncbi:MAG: hypothetical protein KBG48_35115 [Kofleriaceae bacterium]|jgi:hypothetical protein|nr:hypothetical protein [Kofleriaceae bacterium]MBP9172643.1 hypothetical protein [Kofleriaceae bacterium]MBP9863113.1 hypothetical protein [Kofleriaceae bacterium]